MTDYNVVIANSRAVVSIDPESLTAVKALTASEDEEWFQLVVEMLPVWIRAECKRFNRRKKQRRQRTGRRR